MSERLLTSPSRYLWYLESRMEISHCHLIPQGPNSQTAAWSSMCKAGSWFSSAAPCGIGGSAGCLQLPQHKMTLGQERRLSRVDIWLGLGQRAVHERLQLSRSSGSLFTPQCIVCWAKITVSHFATGFLCLILDCACWWINQPSLRSVGSHQSLSRQLLEVPSSRS